MKLDQQGFTLVHMMLAVGLSSIVIMALTSAVTTSIRGIQSVERMNEAFALTDETRTALSRAGICTGNFGGKPMAMNGTLEMESLAYFDEFGNRQEDFVTKGDNYQRLDVEQMVVAPRVLLGAERILADLMIDVRKKGDVIGSQVTRKFIPVLFSVKNGLITSCVADTNTGPRFFEKVCVAGTEGRYYFDPGDGQCKDRFIYMQAESPLLPGAATTVNCPDGWEPSVSKFAQPSPGSSVCYASVPGGDPFASMYQSVTRHYSDGSSRTSTPSPVIASFNQASGQCTCIYATDFGAPPAGMKCSLHCDQVSPNHPYIF